MDVARLIARYICNRIVITLTERGHRFLLFVVLGAGIYRSADWLIAVAIGVLITDVTYGLAFTMRSHENATNAMSSVIFRTGRLVLRKIDLKSHLDPWLWFAISYRRVFSYSLWRTAKEFDFDYEPVQAFVVSYTGGEAPGQIKAYVSGLGTSYLFFPDNPEFSNPVLRFWCYHELAHVSEKGVTIFPKALASRILLLVEVPFFLCAREITLLYAAGLFVYVWAHIVTSSDSILDHEVELKADAFACKYMRSAAEVTTVAQAFEDETSDCGPFLSAGEIPFRHERIRRMRAAARLIEAGQASRIYDGSGDFVDPVLLLVRYGFLAYVAATTEQIGWPALAWIAAASAAGQLLSGWLHHSASAIEALIQRRISSLSSTASGAA